MEIYYFKVASFLSSDIRPKKNHRFKKSKLFLQIHSFEFKHSPIRNWNIIKTWYAFNLIANWITCVLEYYFLDKYYGSPIVWDTSKETVLPPESSCTMLSIFYSFLIIPMNAYDHESRDVIIKTKSQKSYLAKTRLKKHGTRESQSPSDYALG